MGHFQWQTVTVITISAIVITIDVQLSPWLILEGFEDDEYYEYQLPGSPAPLFLPKGHEIEWGTRWCPRPRGQAKLVKV